MPEAPKGLILNLDHSGSPEPVYVDEVQGGTTPSGLVFLSFYVDHPDLPTQIRSTDVSVSAEGSVTFNIPSQAYEHTEEGLLSVTRKIGASVLMPRSAARKLAAWINEQFAEEDRA